MLPLRKSATIDQVTPWKDGTEGQNQARNKDMTPRTQITAILTAMLMLASASLAAAQPQVGEPAPGFRLQDQKGEWHELAQYRGSWVVLYFYPKDDTPGCTTQACNFRDDIFEFRKLGVTVLGVSLDDVASHQEFAEKYSLPFSLLADSDSETAEKYGVVRNLGVAKFARRETFIIDPEGRVAKHYDKVDPDGHSKELIGELKSRMSGG